MNIIDCVGFLCPKPVIEVKKYFEKIEEGEAEIIVDNEVALNNVSKYLNNLDISNKSEKKEGLYYIYASKNECKTCKPMNLYEELVIIVPKKTLGEGSETLGETLMKSYIFALSENEITPKTIIFLNGGVFLTTEGSLVIDSLLQLKNKGSEILSCGTCLDFYNLKEKLIIGEVSNMYTIVEKMNSSKNTIVL